MYLSLNLRIIIFFLFLVLRIEPRASREMLSTSCVRLAVSLPIQISLCPLVNEQWCAKESSKVYTLMIALNLKVFLLWFNRCMSNDLPRKRVEGLPS